MFYEQKNHIKLCEVHGKSTISDRMVRRSCCQFDEDRTDVHQEHRSGRLSLITYELVLQID